MHLALSLTRMTAWGVPSPTAPQGGVDEDDRAAATTAGLALAACGGGGGGGAPADLELTAADAGKTVSVEQGQAVVVALDSNASTGYRWNLVEKPDEAVLGLASSEYTQTGEALGSPGVETWRFEATGAGKTSLRLAYFRPFDPQDVQGEFELRVEVK